MNIALVHDYLTQRGGAERVVLSMVRAFPEAPLYTSLFDPSSTFPEFERAPILPLRMNRVPALRKNHRLALPFLAAAFARLEVPGDVVLCSSSGWAHGVRTPARKVVYCYSPARWLYQTERYLPRRKVVARATLGVLRRRLMRWDLNAALASHRYVTTSFAIRDRIRAVYGIDAEVLPPPPPIDAGGPQRPIDGIDPGYFLCVSRLLPYKNVDMVVEAFADLPAHRLVVVGSGPDRQRLMRNAPAGVTFLHGVADDELRWLYANSAGVVAASYEDYGLTPLEGAALGTPSIVLRWGGFRETVVEGETGLFFDEPDPAAIRRAVAQAAMRDWDKTALRGHAARYSEQRFIGRLRAIVAEEAAFARGEVQAPRDARVRRRRPSRVSPVRSLVRR